MAKLILFFIILWTSSLFSQDIRPAKDSEISEFDKLLEEEISEFERKHEKSTHSFDKTPTRLMRQENHKVSRQPKKRTHPKKLIRKKKRKQK